MYIGAV